MKEEVKLIEYLDLKEKLGFIKEKIRRLQSQVDETEKAVNDLLELISLKIEETHNIKGEVQPKGMHSL